MTQLTESDNKEQQTSRPIGGMVFLAVVILLLMYGAWWVSDYLEDAQKAPINQIVVTINGQQLQQQAIEQQIRAMHPESFFELDVNTLHSEIENMPWVYRASIRKRWPNSLMIYIVEQIASARWNDDSLLNQFGDSFDARLADPSLPDLFGPGGSEKTALQGFRAMQTLLNSADLSINELFLSERFAWNLRLNNGITLNLGRSEFVDRLQRFVDIYPLLKKQEKQVEYVDLRYDTGLAVGWKNADSKQQQS